MRLAAAIALVFSAMLAGAVDAADPVPPTITQLHIDKKTPEDLHVNLVDTEGVHCVVVLAEPDQYIIGVDEEASKLTSATDDKGTDLTENNRNKWISRFFSQINKSHHKVAVPMAFATVPAPGATTIHVQADIVLNCGRDEKTDTLKAFDLAKGAAAQYGTHSLEITLDKHALTFSDADDKSPQKLAVILNERGTWLKTLEFLDEKGTAIKAAEPGSMRIGDTITRSFTLPSDVKTIGVRVTYYEKIEQIHRAVDVEMTIGLP